MINTITINSATCSAVLSPLWQYDYGQYLKIEGIDLPQSFEVDFATIDQSSSVTMLGEDGQVKVPDDMLDAGVDITAYIYLHSDETDGYTEYVIQIPVISRPDRTEETPTPQEQTLIEQAITVLNHAVEQTGQDVEAAQQAADDAEAAASSASTSAQTASTAATSASTSATAAATSASAAETSAGQAAVSATSAAASASDAEQSAQTAQSAVASIGDSVTRAESAASTATGAAQTASAKAAEANTSAGVAASNATTATVKAQEAAQSATQAAQSATAAQTAQTGAEAAQTGAETAQTAAESAAAQAEAQADRAEGYADRLIDVYPTDTASGSIASFPDGADSVEVKAATVQIEPVQDLHGQASPWPAGGGKNLLNYADFSSSYRITSVTDNGDGSFTVIANENAAYIDHIINVVPNQTYCIKAESATNVSGNASQMSVVIVYDGQTSADPVLLDNKGILTQKTFTPTSNVILVRNKVTGGAGPGTGLIVKPQLEAGSTATAYAPYENLCPISGWTGAKVTRAGKNLFDSATVFVSFGFTHEDDGSWSRENINGIANVQLWENPGFISQISIRFTAKYASDTSTGIGFKFKYTDGTFLNLYLTPSLTYQNYTFTSNPDKVVSGIFFDYGSNNIKTWFKDVQFEASSTPTPYEPYSGDTYDISWESEVGTVYGGTLTYDGDGVWTVESNMTLVDLGSLTWGSAVSGVQFFYASVPDIQRPTWWDTLIDAKCSCYKVVSGNDISAGVVGIGGNPNNSQVRVYDPTYSTVADFKAGVTGQMLCYKTTQPTTYTLTPAELLTLLGQNNIFADCGDTSVTYRADIQLYIQKMIAAALNS